MVVVTGSNTYFGALAKRVTATTRTLTAFQSGINKVSWLLIRFMLVMTPVVLLHQWIYQGGLAGSLTLCFIGCGRLNA